MAINLVTYANQSVTPQDDALLYQTAIIKSGIIYGCEVTIKDSTTLHITAGHGVICGRKFSVTAQDVVVSLSGSGDKQGRLYIHMDLSNASTPIQFLTQVANTLTPVVQESDANITNGIYEFNLATFDVGTSTISNLVDVTPFADNKFQEIQSKVLTAGSSTVSFDVPTEGDYLIDFYTSNGAAYSDIDLNTPGIATLTFNTQSSNITVYCKADKIGG